jgi:hypothetical protein
VWRIGSFIQSKDELVLYDAHDGRRECLEWQRIGQVAVFQGFMILIRLSAKECI